LFLIATSLLLGTTFLVFEAKYARQPIFPPRLLIQRDVATSYSIGSLQTAAQLAVYASRPQHLSKSDTIQMMFSVPLYFQVMEGASNRRAGSHLVLAVLGNTIGGLLTDYLIRKHVPPTPPRSNKSRTD
jgi:hypothetical protein